MRVQSSIWHEELNHFQLLENHRTTSTIIPLREFKFLSTVCIYVHFGVIGGSSNVFAVFAHALAHKICRELTRRHMSQKHI